MNFEGRKWNYDCGLCLRTQYSPHHILRLGHRDHIRGVCMPVWWMLVTRQRSLGMMTSVEYLASTSITAQGTTLYTYTSLKTPLLSQLQKSTLIIFVVHKYGNFLTNLGLQECKSIFKSIWYNVYLISISKLSVLSWCKNQTYVLCIMLFQNLNIQIFCWYKYWSSSTHPICIDHRCPDGSVVTSKHGEKIKI